MYDISTSPPTLLSTVHTDVGFRIQVVGSQLLFADARVFDISGTAPAPLTELPTRIVQSVQGNRVLALGLLGDWEIIDVSNPLNPVVTANVADLTTMDLVQQPYRSLVGEFYLLHRTVSEGWQFTTFPSREAQPGLAGIGHFLWGTTFDQVVQQQMVYAAGQARAGDGTPPWRALGLGC